MATYRTIQSVFISGVLPPLMEGAVGTQTYSSGLAVAENCYYGSGGGLVKRPGTRLQGTAYDNSCIFPFLIGDTIKGIEFGDKKARLITFSHYGTQEKALIGPDVITPYAIADVPSLSITSQRDTLYIVHKNYQPRTLKIENGLLSTPEIISFVQPITPDNPQEGDKRTTAMTFSKEGDYPSFQAFSGGRWFLIATKNQPNAIWYSRTFDSATGEYRYNDFTLTEEIYVIDVNDPSHTYWESMTGSLADLGGSYISSDMYGSSFRWVMAHQTFLVATGRSIYSGDASVVTSTAMIEGSKPFSLTPSLSFGSSTIIAVSLGNYIFFVGSDGTSIRCMAYSQQYNTYSAADIMSPVSQYLSSGIKRLAVTDGPIPHLWVLSNDGELLCCQFEPSASVVAWSRLTFNADDIPEWIEGFQGGEDGKAFLTIIMKRGENRYIETLDELPTSEIWKRPAVDAYEDITGTTTSVTGPCTIVEITTGDDDEDRYIFNIIEEGESFSDFNEDAQIIRGSGYSMAIATLRSELPANGTSQGAKRAIRKSTLRLVNSCGGIVAKFDGFTPGQRKIPKLSEVATANKELLYPIFGLTKYGDALPLYTGDKDTQFVTKSLFDDRLAIISSEPYPFALCSIIVERSPMEA